MNKISKLSIALITPISMCSLSIKDICAHLVSRCGLSEGVSLTIIAAIVGGAGEVVTSMWPVIKPFFWTIKGIILAAGTGAAVGF